MRALPRHPMSRIVLVWGLIVALVIYGGSGALLQMLGPMHRHADLPQTAAHGALAERFEALASAARQWHERVVTQALFAHERERFLPSARPVEAQAGLGAHLHSHGPFERHRHANDDTSVVSLDGGSSAADGLSPSSGTLGSASLPMCLSPALTVPEAGRCGNDWHPPSPPRWRNAALKLLERPPQA